jgi:hypothetical protein
VRIERGRYNDKVGKAETRSRCKDICTGECSVRIKEVRVKLGHSLPIPTGSTSHQFDDDEIT